MSKQSYQGQLVLFIAVAITSIARFITATCMKSPYTSLIDSEIAHLEWMELTHSDYINATLNAYTPEQSCSKVYVNENTPYNLKTLCPWDYIQDVDVNRFPPVLSVAKCRCSSCFDNFQCTPVLYSIPVLKKQCHKGVLHWVRKTQLVSVACTCSRPTIHHVRKRISKLFELAKYGHR